MRRGILLAGLAAALLAACSVMEGIVKSGGMDIVSAAAETFAPGYSALVSRFVGVLRKSTDDKPSSAPSSSGPASSHPSSYPAVAQSPPPSPSSMPQSGPANASSDTTRGAGGVTTGSTTRVESRPTDPNAPLSIEFDLMREVVIEGRSIPVSVRNGDTLRDGGGIGGDNYKIFFRATQPCHVYVVQADSTGKLDVLFPGGLSGGHNPVPAGVECSIPGASNWLYLDQNKGIEHIFFLASRDPNAELSDVLAKLERAEPIRTAQPARRIDTPLVVTRGAGGTRPGTMRPVAFENGATASFSPTEFLAMGSRSSQIVQTRWFRHE
jgi:uncharacterized protein DUF4384